MSASTDTLLDSSKASRTARAWAAEPKSSLAPFSIQRREPLADDVVIDILYCGVSDLHQARNECTIPSTESFPATRSSDVSLAGRGVTKFKEGDLAAVGLNSVDSCRVCAAVSICEKFPTFTYNGIDKTSRRITFRRLLRKHRGRSGLCAQSVREGEPRRHRSAFCAPASPPIRPCAIGMSGPARR